MKRLLALASTLVIAAGVYLALSAIAETDSGPDTAAAATATGSSPTRLRLSPNLANRASRELRALPTRQWEPGMRFHYSVDARRAITLNRAPEPMLRRGLDGLLTLTVIERDDALIHVQALFSGQFWQNPENPDASLSGSTKPVIASYAAPDGRLEMLHTPAGISGALRDRFAALLSELQLSVPEDAGHLWELEELDTGGEYLAVYTRMPDGALERTKARYMRTVSKDGLALSENASEFSPSGSARISVGTHGWPTDVDIDEALTVDTGQLTVGYAGVVKAKLHTIDTVAIPALSWNQLQTHHIASTGDQTASQCGHDQNRVQGAGYEQVSGELRRIIAEYGYDARRFPAAQSKMAALFRLDPDTAARAGREALTTDDEKYAKALASSLGLAGTPEAQRALMDIIEADDAPLPRRKSATVATAVTNNATRETLERLTNIAASSALFAQSNLALGGAVQRAMDGVETDSAIDTLLARYAAADNDTDRTLYMQALGNTGDRRILPSIESAITSTHAPLRHAALDALRFVPGSDVDTLLRVHMSGSGEDERRIAMSAALRRSSPLFLAGFIERLTADPVDTIRLLAIRGLSNSATQPGVAAVLQTAATSDASEEVRNAAAITLADIQ